MKNAFTRATKYLRFRKMKSIVLVMLFTVLSLTLLLSNSINSTIDSYYSELDTTNGISVSINPIMKFESGSNGQPGTPPDRQSVSFVTTTDEQVEQIRTLDYVTNVKSSTTVTVTSSTLEAIDYSEETTASEDAMSSATQKVTSMPNDVNMSGLKLVGSDNLSLESDFTNSTVSLSSGEMPSSTEEVLVSTTFAKLNDLKVGDSIDLSSSDETLSNTYKISGLYTYNLELDEMAQRIVPENNIYSTYEGATKVKDSTTRARTTTTYYIESADKLEQFKTDYFEITQQDSSSFDVELDDEVYTSTISPLIQLSETLSTVVIVVIVFIGVILAIVSYLMIKERNYEIGVLYSLSESKKNIVLQFIFENTILLTIGFAIALVINSMLSTSIINGLLNMDIFSNVNENAMRMQGGPGGPMGVKNFNETTEVSVETSISTMSIIYSYAITWLVVCGVNILTISKTLLKRVKEIINS